MEERFWHKAYAKDVAPTINYETLTLPDVLKRTAHKHPETIALVMMGKTITYRRLNELVNRFSSALADLGIQKGDKVSLILPNMPQVIIASYAVFRLGAVVVMNNPLYTETELAHQLNDLGFKDGHMHGSPGPQTPQAEGENGDRNHHFLPHPRLSPFPEKTALSLC